MEENGKYIRLFGTIFFSFIGFIVANILILVSLKLLFGLLDKIPLVNLLFTLFVVSVPAVLFTTVYCIYFKHTIPHPSKIVRFFSYTIFTIALAAWLYFFVADLIRFFKFHYSSIAQYNTYNLAFLAANVLVIFFIGIVQALTVYKEPNWLDKHNIDNKD